MKNKAITGMNEPELKSGLLDTDELSKYLGVSMAMIQIWMKEGKLPFYQIGRRSYFKKSEILKGY